MMAEAAVTLALISTAFSNGGDIPRKYTCQGEDISPSLSWSGVPKNAKALVLIVDDPDAPDPASPKMTWVHWVVYNIPATVEGFPEGQKELPAGAQAGFNDWHKKTWGGPCPPVGKHRYFFKLYALDQTIHFVMPPTKSDLEKTMAKHVLAHAELIGLYQKK
jgi:Raf kinase inhibitor-like YbhB/YbcL family protein